MKQGEIIELEIPSAPEYVSVVRRAIEGIAQRMSFGPDDIEDLKVAVGEACTNAVKYGCPNSDERVVGIRCLVREDGLQVEIRNNVNDCACPTVPKKPDLGREGGLGLYLMRNLMDEVELHWEDETAIVTMMKRF